MAEKKSSTSSPGKTADVKRSERETVYPAKDLVKAAHRFNTQEECVEAALRFYGKKEATLKETEEMVKKFLKREVK